MILPLSAAAPWYFPAAIDGPSHRIHPPAAAKGVRVTVPAKAVSLPLKAGWHATGQILPGIKASVVGFTPAPWLRQRCSGRDKPRPAGKCCPTLRARLGLRTYGTLGNVNGTKVPQQQVAFGSVDVDLPTF